MIEVVNSFLDPGMTGKNIGTTDTIAEETIGTDVSREGDVLVETERLMEPRAYDDCVVGFAVG